MPIVIQANIIDTHGFFTGNIDHLLIQYILREANGRDKSVGRDESGPYGWRDGLSRKLFHWHTQAQSITMPLHVLDGHIPYLLSLPLNHEGRQGRSGGSRANRRLWL